jgi:Domain of unknown function (4846)
MKITILILVFVMGLFSFSKLETNLPTASESNTIGTRFAVPIGYVRVKEEENSFGAFLRNLPLKPVGSLVKYYNGSTKPNNNVYDAVVNLPIGNKDLHQCADAVMRLRADYLYAQKAYDKIHFNFTNGFKVEYNKWRLGNRIAVKGNKTSWVKTAKPSDSYESYWKYMELIFNYAGTSSLSKELQSIPVSDVKIGDIFIKGGFPGHAVIVVDMAVNPKNNQKIMLLAQSYMPAQEIQILLNPSISSNNRVCWYSTSIASKLETPEWTFDVIELKRF